MDELLLHVGDSPTSSWRDGDIMQAVRNYDALRVHAELIVRGRGAYQGTVLPSLRSAYESITRAKNQVLPEEDDLLDWWNKARRKAGLDLARFERFPWSATERKLHLVVPLGRDITLAEKQQWAGKPASEMRDEATGTVTPAFTPRYVDWQRDILGEVEVKTAARLHLGFTFDATADDVRDPCKSILVRHPVADDVVRVRQ